MFMKFDEVTREKFINDTPFYENEDCYCLGNTLEECGEILKIISDIKQNNN